MPKYAKWIREERYKEINISRYYNIPVLIKNAFE